MKVDPISPTGNELELTISMSLRSMDSEEGFSETTLLLLFVVVMAAVVVVVLGFLGVERRMLLSEDGGTRLKPPPTVVDPIPKIEEDEIEEWEGLLFIKFSVLEYCGSL